VTSRQCVDGFQVSPDPGLAALHATAVTVLAACNSSVQTSLLRCNFERL